MAPCACAGAGRLPSHRGCGPAGRAVYRGPVRCASRRRTAPGRRRSSVVEQLIRNQQVPGSRPGVGTNSKGLAQTPGRIGNVASNRGYLGGEGRRGARRRPRIGRHGPTGGGGLCRKPPAQCPLAPRRAVVAAPSLAQLLARHCGGLELHLAAEPVYPHPLAERGPACFPTGLERTGGHASTRSSRLQLTAGIALPPLPALSACPALDELLSE